MNTTISTSSPQRRWPLALAVAALVAGLLALAGPAIASANTLNVNPVTGNDSNTGTAIKPFKTLTRGLKLAQSGDVVTLAAGGYGPGASGDKFPQSGLPVPVGVTIQGALDSGSPVSTLLGPGGGAALNLAGNATVRNLGLGGQGFGVGLYAKQGTQTLNNLFIGMPAGKSATIDGFSLGGGVFLRGSAQATLKGSTIFLLSGDATGVKVNEQARLTMDGGTITGGDQPNCRTGALGIELNQAAQATLTNINAPGFQNLAGGALMMRDTSKATLGKSLVVGDLPAGCAPRPAVSVRNSAALTMQGATQLVQHASDGSRVGMGIEMGSSGPLKLQQASVGGYGRGLETVAGGTGSLTLDHASFSSCQVCVDATSATGPLTIVDSFLRGGSKVGGGEFERVGLIAPHVKMRRTLVSDNNTGILVTGPGADLGTATQSGNNTIINNLITGVKIGTPSSLVLAEGNTWEPNTQSADASGRYPNHLLVNGLSPLATGRNFNVKQSSAPDENRRIQLGPGAAVGT